MGDRPRRSKSTPAGKALVRSATRALAPALAALDDNRLGDTVLVHHLRKSLKRWRATLRLIEPFLGAEGRAARRKARDLARSLAGAREPRSALDALADLGTGDSRLARAAAAAPRSRLEALRQEAEATTLKTAQRTRIKKALAAAKAQAQDWPLQRLAAADVAARIADGYRRARRAIPADFASVADADLHEFRQRVVAHRYQMEMVAPLSAKLGKARVEAAQNLREELGACQDLAVLAGYAAPGQPLAAWRSQLTSAIAERQRVHRKAAERLARRLFAEKPGAFRRQVEALWRKKR